MRLSLLSEEQYKSAVAIVIHDGKLLLGRSTANDDRNDLLCFPAGGIKEGETPEQAAVRECGEETGYKVEAASSAFGISERPDTAYVHCRLLGGKAKPNHEFSSLGWMASDKLRLRDDIYPVNLKVLDEIEAPQPQGASCGGCGHYA